MKLFRYVCLIVFCLCAFTPALHAQLIENFEQGNTWDVRGPAKLESSCTVVDSPQRVGKSLQVSWGVPREKYLEVFVKEHPVIEGFDTSAKPNHATVSVDVFSPGSEELHRMSVRFVDKHGEVYQWQTSINAVKKEGWHTVKFDIRPDNSIVHWGGAEEHKDTIDGPVKFIAVTFDFDSRVEPAQDAKNRRIFLDNISVELPQGTKTVPASAEVTTVEDFEQSPQWHVYKPEDFHANCQIADAPNRQGKSLQVHWDLPRAKYFETYLAKRIPLTGLDTSIKPYHATITLDVFSPGTAEVMSLSMRLRDEEDETFQWSTRANFTREGWQTLSFDIKPDNFRDSWGGKQNNPKQLDGKLSLSGIAVGFNTQIAASDNPQLRRLFLDNITIKLPPQAPAAKAPVKQSQQATAIKLGKVDLDRIDVSLNTGHPMHIVDPTNPQPAFMMLNNKSNTAQRVVLDMQASSFLGREYSFKRTLTLPARKVTPHFLPLPQDKQDQWWIYYTLADPDSAEKVSDREMLGMMTPNGNNPEYHPRDRFLFGMCSHSGRYDDQTMQAEAYATGLIGIDISRTALTWGHLQPDADTWKWDKMDRLLELYKAQNVELQYLCAFTPQWATTGDASSKDWLVWSRAAPRLDAWENYLRNVVGRYHKDIRFWEIWNEPDLPFFRGTAEEYIQMCKVAYPTIKSVAPEVTVLSGGWSAANRNPGFIETVLSQNADTFDILAVHAHGFFGSFRKIVDLRWGELRKQYVQDKPIYFNETGLSSPGDTIDADTQQAVELVRKVTFTMGRGAMAYNWYDLRHDGDNPNDHEHRYGMITRDFQAKPAYIAYNTLIGLLRGYKFHKQLMTNDDQWMFLFENDNQYVLVGWSQQPYAVGQVVLHADSKTVQHVDMMGNRRTLPRLSDGSVVIGLEMQPAYWTFDKSTVAPALTNNLIELPGIAAWIPNEPNKIAFNFTNPLENKADFLFRVQLPMALGGATMQFNKAIEAGQKVSLSLPIGQVSGEVDYARPFTCIMQYQDRDYQLKGSCQIPIQWAGVIHKGSMPDKPTFTLDHRDQIFDKYIADPSTKHRLWTGPEDLSAKTWVWLEGQNLRFRSVVNDDKHVQTNPANALWKSDSIQLAMQLPGQNGMWEINLGRTQDGKSLVNPGIVPQGLDASAVNNAALKTSGGDGQVIYDLTLPLSALSVTPEKFAQGLYLSMLINDDDGLGRDGWIALSAGIGNGKDPSCYPLFVVK